MIYWTCGFLFGLICGFLIPMFAIYQMEKDREKGEPFVINGKVYKYTERKEEKQ